MNITEKPMPSAVEAEMAVLGGMVLDPVVIPDVQEVLEGGASDFHLHKHAAIYNAIIALHDSKKPTNAVGLQQFLKDRGELELVGGVIYLIELFESVPSAYMARHHAVQVREKARVRKLIEFHLSGLQTAHSRSDDAESLLEEAEAAIFAMNTGSKKQESVSLNELLNERYATLEKSDGHDARAVATGYYELDEILGGGLQPGQLIIIGARPSMGKTAIVLNMLEHAGFNQKVPSVFFSLEMNRSEIGNRIMASQARANVFRMKRNMISAEMFADLAQVVGASTNAPIQIDDTGGLSLIQIRSRARRMAARHHVRAVYIDYLQLIGGAPGVRYGNRQEEVASVSRGLKAMAKELDVPVVCLSQLNRKAEDRADNRPHMSDLRESGSVEADADVVMLLHREDYYRKPDEERNNVGEVIVAKQRNGPQGSVKLAWNPTLTRFDNSQRQGFGENI